MHVVLLPLGLAIGLAGIALIGIGVPKYTQTLGNTLIIAGAIALVGGLTLIGMASGIRQLRRIAKALEARPGGLAATPGALEPRLPMPIVAAPPEPVLPREPELPARSEPVATRQEEPSRRDQAVAPAAAAEAGGEMVARLAPLPPVQRKSVFDTIWSARPVVERPSEKAVPARTAPQPATTPRSESVAEEVKIFKSGVIDGMAYTLYSDGSIEAELTEGTVKFSSIDELRAYLTARE